MRVLVLGGTGFAGSHLARACLEAGDEVTITGRAPERSRPGQAMRVLCVDVHDEASVAAAVETSRPERVYHLAGQSSVDRSLHSEEEVLRTNVLGTLHVLRAVRAKAPAARVLYVGSAEEYGRVPPERQPIGEDEPLAPVSPYGVSRASASLLALRHALTEDLHVVRTRSFNHTGAGQTLDFVLPSWADQLVRARRRGERRATVRTGDVTVERDFSGVRSVALAYRALLEKGRSGDVVNVCSGRARRLSDLLGSLGRLAGVEPVAVLDQTRVRRVQIPTLRGDPSRLEAMTGLSLADSLDADLEALVRETERRVAEQG